MQALIWSITRHCWPWALVGHVLGSSWAGVVLGAALGVTVYWPIACLWTVKAARGAVGWDFPKELQYWIVLPAIAGWGALGLLLLSLGTRQKTRLGSSRPDAVVMDADRREHRSLPIRIFIAGPYPDLVTCQYDSQ
jgi:hypothetical protein